MKLLSVREARDWAKGFTGRDVTSSNITYLVNYARIRNFGKNGQVKVSQQDLYKYYKNLEKEIEWKKTLGDDLNWTLSFDQYKESERTKHVHRLHPYKGKFIPQLVEYFIDSHTDKFKTEVYFKPGDIILDPFCGSGTTLVEANEKKIHAIGIDISEFNSMISNTKLYDIDYFELSVLIDDLNYKFEKYVKETGISEKDQIIKELLSQYNNEYFPSPQFKWEVKGKHIEEYSYGAERLKDFLKLYDNKMNELGLDFSFKDKTDFKDKWFFPTVKAEIEFLRNEIDSIRIRKLRHVLKVILSRTIRSCRATSHSDLATLQKPVYLPYYCRKHKKICKPLFSSVKWWRRYSQDTINRYLQFNSLKTNTHQYCLTGDARNINIELEIREKNTELYELLKNKRIQGIFSSPPYVGLINYHEQHQYAYEFFGFKNRQDDEIGPLFRGKGKQAKESYIDGISKVLLNTKKFLADNYDVFLVANDKFGLYEEISSRADMKIVQQYKRPVLNRTEKDKAAYSEIIFHLKEK